jgi:hypothetical protein
MCEALNFIVLLSIYLVIVAVVSELVVSFIGV